MPEWFCLLVALAASLGSLSNRTPEITHGVASGDVTDSTALLWARANVTCTLESEFSKDPVFTTIQAGPSVEAQSGRDFTGQILLSGLEPATRYYYRIRARNRAGASQPLSGSFITAPRSEESRDVCFLWGGDLGGQGFCRKPEQGYDIFEAMTNLSADFVLFSGDMIYADSPCTSPPNLPDADFVAFNLEEFRQRWKYNRADPHHRKFLASTSMVTQWDDHEVTNDFAGPHERLMPVGRRAYFEYHPMSRQREDSARIYRKLRWGKELELFVLDNRQYRSPNMQPDSTRKSMLGRRQFLWLTQSLSRSDSVWKVIATSVPLTVPTGTNWQTKGRDGWANGSTGLNPSGHNTGWEHELLSLFRIIRDRRIQNVLWITTDVHFAQVASLDPFAEGRPSTYEFISGPLSAIALKPGGLDTTLNPTRLYAEGQFFNFGRISIDANTHRLTVEIRTPEGPGQSSVRYSLVLDPAR